MGMWDWVGAAFPVATYANYFATGVSDMVSANKDREAQEAANDKNIQLAREQMDFQERMSSSAYQRAAMDMRRAGLNPNALASGVNAASTPGGSQARVEATKPGQAMRELASSARNAAPMMQQLEQNDANIQLTKASEVTQQAQAAAQIASAKKAEQEAINTEMENKVMKKKMPALAKQAELSSSQADLDKTTQIYDHIVNKVSDTGSALGRWAGGLFRGVKSGNSGGPPGLPPDVARTRSGDLIHRKTGEVLYEKRR